MSGRTKAQTLKYLYESDRSFNILPLLIIRWNDYLMDPQKTVKLIKKNFERTDKLIVRSSSTIEDKEEFSNAGHFLSVTNVSRDSDTEIKAAIERVYASYGTQENEEILIQPMLENVLMSGVVFTRDVFLNTPYYTINYSVSADTFAVTGGCQNHLKTLIVYKDKIELVGDRRLSQLLVLCKSLECFMENDSLDIEFACDACNRIYILQVRPLVREGKENIDYSKLDNALNKIYKKVEKLLRPHPFLLGKTTCFGVMPDWNPAEILGVRPKKLAISLYKELITDNIWAHQRNNYGYRDLTMHPLMVSFCGIPYIDTRVTFNSFIPKSLNIHIAEKLADYYISQLSNYPAYHDKIEFEIVFSCYYIGLPDQLKKLLEYGFNENELKRIEFSLLNLTNEVIHPENGLYKKDICKANILENKYKSIIQSDISLVDKIYWLIEVCKTYGTLPFAGVARGGFIAVQFLRSFVSAHLIGREEQEIFLNSLNTVSRQLSRDKIKLRSGQMKRAEFLEKYGHVRPGTYDILSPRYDEDFERYFGRMGSQKEEVKEPSVFSFSENSMERIQLELEQNGLLVTADELIQFIREAIEGREYVKFVFTKLVSKILQLITELGERNHISKADMAHLDIGVVKQLYVDLYYDNLSGVLRQNIEMNKQQFTCAQAIKLPAPLLRPKDVYEFYLLEGEPNYVTLRAVEADVVKEADIPSVNLTGKVIFVQSADPGYDFLFAHNIGGLITEFGGANSHMTIRCAELGIPAIIGAGEKNYFHWVRFKRLLMDCANKKVVEL